ncbi:MAG: HepT-like ribonuclease domain-containing protein [Geminicoccales bacterium]
MAPAPVTERLRHILDAVVRIEALTAGKTFEDYMADWVIRDAVERNLERASEASRHIPAEIKARHKHIARRSVAGLGNILRHDYPRVKDPRVWRIVTSDLPLLKTAVEAMLREAEAGPDRA